MQTQFSKNARPIQLKGRGIPMHLQELFENELNKLIDQNHIIKFSKCLDP